MPVCLVAHDVLTGQRIEAGRDELHQLEPIGVAHDELLVVYEARAEVGVYLELGWPIPCNVLDLCAEGRWYFCGRPPTRRPASHEMLNLCAWFDISTITAGAKDAGRALVMRGPPWTPDEMRRIVRYCGTDVDATVALYHKLEPHLDMDRALLRGHFVAVTAAMERRGLPIDTALHDELVERWSDLTRALVERLDNAGIYDGTTFQGASWLEWTRAQGIDWPRLASGAPQLDKDTFKEQEKLHPVVGRYRELRRTLSQLKKRRGGTHREFDGLLPVGRDGRARTSLFPFASKTGRTQARASEFVFAFARWLRCLVRPAPGMAVVYSDWKQQEFHIAAALSGDRNMLAAAAAVDPYLKLAKLAGAVPAGASKQSHPRERDLFKQATLAAQFGQTAQGLAARAGIQYPVAEYLLRQHRQTYEKFWQWNQQMVYEAVAQGHAYTRYGWRMAVGELGEQNERSIGNFRIQGAGSDIMRIAAVLLHEAGVQILCPVHDAFVTECPVDELREHTELVREIMREASSIYLDGHAIDVDELLCAYPDRFSDPDKPDAGAMFNTVLAILEELRARGPSYSLPGAIAADSGAIAGGLSYRPGPAIALEVAN